MAPPPNEPLAPPRPRSSFAPTAGSAKYAIFARRPTPHVPSPAKHSSLPGAFPADASLSILDCSVCGGDGEDRISLLPNVLLTNIIGRLPVKDAARTTVLSSRWLRIWHSTPLFLDDDDLLPALEGVGIDTIAYVISCILDSHPGPFRFVRLTYSCEYAASKDDGALLRKWIGAIADKGVDDLVLLNRLRPANGNLPADILRLSSLCHLDLGNWVFPSTDDLTCDDKFPYLLELGLCRTDIGTADLDRIIRFSPYLKKFALIASDNSPPSVLVRSFNLQCVLFWKTVAQKVHVLAAPRLERLILYELTGACLPTKLSIGNAPKLKTVGYLDPRSHVLELCDTVVQLATSPLPMLPSVKTLALKFRIGVPKEANMVPVYLRCFPSVQTLHVMLDEVDEPSVKPDFRIWQEAGHIHCLLSTMETVVLKNFRGDELEFEFFMFLFDAAKVLKKAVIVLADGCETGKVVLAKLKSVWQNRAGRKPTITVQTGGTKWNFHTASDLFVSDPFDF